MRNAVFVGKSVSSDSLVLRGLRRVRSWVFVLEQKWPRWSSFQCCPRLRLGFNPRHASTLMGVQMPIVEREATEALASASEAEWGEASAGLAARGVGDRVLAITATRSESA